MTIHVRHDRLMIDDVPARYVPARYYDDTRMTPWAIVAHDTAGALRRHSSVEWFAAPSRKVSAHVVIEREGSITQMVPLDRKAFHADPSAWDGRRNLNHWSIGIELVNPGRLMPDGRGGFRADFGPFVVPDDGRVVRVATPDHGDAWWLDYTPEQIATLRDVCRAIVAAYPTVRHVVGHYQIAPGRKIDPTPMLDLAALGRDVLGPRGIIDGEPAGPRALAMGDADARPDGPVRAAQARLAALGYGVGQIDGLFGARMRAAVAAFELENGCPRADGVLAPDEVDLLMSAIAKPMPIGERAVATVSDVRAWSTEVRVGDAAIGAGKTVTAVTVVDAAADAAAGVSPVGIAMDYLGKAGEMLAKVGALGVTPSPRVGAVALGLVCGVVMWRWGRTVQWRRVLRWRKGD